jgi:hypothetical protein
MAQGRCAGCGKSDSSAKALNKHIMSCPQYVALFQKDPARALTPEAEYERWQAEDNNPEAREAAREARISVRIAESVVKQGNQHTRWATPPDILDD